MKVCRKCLIEKDDSCFKPESRICKQCRSKLDYQSFKKRNLNSSHKNRILEIRKSNRVNSPWMMRFTDYYQKLTGSRAYSKSTKETLALLCAKRILSLRENKFIDDYQAKTLYKMLRDKNHTKESLMIIVKQIFNLPKITGGLNART